MNKQFVVGDRVRWCSGGAGESTEKVGEVIFAVPARGEMDAELARMIAAKAGHDKVQLRADFGSYRKDESYLVLVPHGGRGQPRLYHPRSSALEPA